MSKLLESVSDARVTLQRLSDAKILHGWVISSESGWLNIRLHGNFALSPPDRFSGRIYRGSEDILFTVAIRAGAGQIYHFQLEGDITSLPAEGDARYMRELMAEVNGFSVEVSDVSSHGMGVVSEFPIRTGDEVYIEIAGITLMGEVRYCRARKTEGTGFRIGIRLMEMSRVDRARWAEIVHTVRTFSPSNRFAA